LQANRISFFETLCARQLFSTCASAVDAKARLASRATTSSRRFISILPGSWTRA
jgi:hypothetical protein